MNEYFLALVYIKKLCLTTFCNDVQQITFGLTLFVTKSAMQNKKKTFFFFYKNMTKCI